MEGSQYCVLWNNYHGSLVETIGVLQRDGLLTDVTVVCSNGSKINAHQLVLSACSTFFRDFILDNPSKHKVVLLPTEIKYPDLQAMVEFMYTGQVCIQQDKLQSFIKGAKYLRIKGLEDNAEESEEEDLILPENVPKSDKNKTNEGNSCNIDLEETLDQSLPLTTIKGEKVLDHRYTQQVNLGNSDDTNENWEMVDRKPVIFHKSKSSRLGHRKRRHRITSLRKVPFSLSNSIICYEQTDKDDLFNKDEPINKVRKLGHMHNESVDLCTCTARKIWSVEDTETLLKAWKETLLQVPPSYFIRSVSLCRRVARSLQQRGVRKNWRQCQVKMKNLRREVQIYKKSAGKTSSRKPSEVAVACEKLMVSIEDIFNKEEEIRREWYEKKGSKVRDEFNDNRNPSDILAQVAALADSDVGDEDTDGLPMETEGDGGYTEGEDCIDTFKNPHDIVSQHRMHSDGVVIHHIVEDPGVHALAKEEPLSATDTDI